MRFSHSLTRLWSPVVGSDVGEARENHRSQGGITTVEMVVALAILSLSLGVLFNVISLSLINTSKAEALLRALLLAQSMLSRVGVDIPLEAGEIRGRSEQELDWRLQTDLYGGESGIARLSVYRVIVEVRSTAFNQSVTLQTLRLRQKEK